MPLVNNSLEVDSRALRACARTVAMSSKIVWRWAVPLTGDVRERLRASKEERAYLAGGKKMWGVWDAWQENFAPPPPNSQTPHIISRRFLTP